MELAFPARNLAEVKFVVEDVEVVVSPDVIVPSLCLESIFRHWQGCCRPAVTEDEPVGRPQDVGQALMHCSCLHFNCGLLNTSSLF